MKKNQKTSKKLRAIDLYSGIGGWKLGLKMAGIDVVKSYEWWQPAIDTANKNFGSSDTSVDIRNLDFSTLPENIDIVVGSPPCTQFSYANRGGSGNIEDGMVDVVQFLKIVQYLKPTYWAMENVVKVVEVIETISRLINVAYFRTGLAIPITAQRYAAGNQDLIKKMSKIQSHSTTNAPTISQYAGIEALMGPQDDVTHMHSEFEKRRDFVHKRLNEIDGIFCVKSQGAFYAFPNISEYINKSKIR